ncbi:FAD-dependent oxidoreductase, partial [Acinetobacter baumannii]
SLGKCFGVEAHMLSPAEVKARYPLLDESRIVGGAFIPGDGQTNPVDSTQALVKGARRGGARIVEGIRVTGFIKEGGAIRAVETSQGRISCE